ncbi:response regulator [Paragemmobacter straminiformis]|uniref:Response regulatory domain-containing protein n=1 Tax=Paragemmobacter straminiformis TaxID=2045119 RepID=A0A842ICV5_9RHOB|nr:response regulator [Gemmobacter straminiformis]MBC2837137.1 hypothetical protein [Gemmobacter straminiformis]
MSHQMPHRTASHLSVVASAAGGAAPRVLIVGRDGADAPAIHTWLDRLGASPVHVGERHLPLEWLDQYATGFDIALVDADHLGDPGDVIDFGQRLRRYAPELPVLMASSRVAQDDLTTERMAFCDATLKKPLTHARLAKGAAQACDNHAHWLASRDSQRPPPRLLGAIP